MPRYSNSHAPGSVFSRKSGPSFGRFAKLFVVFACLAGVVLFASIVLVMREKNLRGGIDSKAGGSGLEARTREAYGSLPLSFEANRGQADPQVKYARSRFRVQFVPHPTRSGAGAQHRFVTCPRSRQ